jgi:CBS domain-containing protein
MGPVVATVPPGATVQDAARLMAARGLDILPVVDSGAFLGTVTSDDLLEYLVDTLRDTSPVGFDHVLAVCELTETDASVVATASQLAQAPGARVTLLHPLVPLDRFLGPDGVRSSLLGTINRTRVSNAVEWMRALLPPGADYRVVIGDAGGAIVKVASETDADLIVMIRPVGRGLFGVSQTDLDEIVRHAPCPVLALPSNVASVRPRGAVGGGA